MYQIFLWILANVNAMVRHKKQQKFGNDNNNVDDGVDDNEVDNEIITYDGDDYSAEISSERNHLPESERLPARQSSAHHYHP